MKLDKTEKSEYFSTSIQNLLSLMQKWESNPLFAPYLDLSLNERLKKIDFILLKE
jgi:hypothetical protein